MLEKLTAISCASGTLTFKIKFHKNICDFLYLLEPTRFQVMMAVTIQLNNIFLDKTTLNYGVVFEHLFFLAIKDAVLF